MLHNTLYECSNVQGKELTTEILTSGVRAVSECHRRGIVKTVSQSCVSQGKVGGKCLQQPVPNQGTQHQSNSDKECRSRRAEGVQERGRQGQATLHLSSGSKVEQSCRGTKPASDRSCTEARGTVQQETQSLITSEVSIKL